jgi:hypothetical protein
MKTSPIHVPTACVGQIFNKNQSLGDFLAVQLAERKAVIAHWPLFGLLLLIQKYRIAAATSTGNPRKKEEHVQVTKPLGVSNPSASITGQNFRYARVIVRDGAAIALPSSVGAAFVDQRGVAVQPEPIEVGAPDIEEVLANQADTEEEPEGVCQWDELELQLSPCLRVTKSVEAYLSHNKRGLGKRHAEFPYQRSRNKRRVQARHARETFRRDLLAEMPNQAPATEKTSKPETPAAKTMAAAAS